MEGSSVDPFRAVQEEVQKQLHDIQADMAKWQKLSNKSPKHEPTRQRILSSISELQVDLEDMQATIDIALKDPAKFALTPSELMSRQTFVRDLQAQANDVRDLLDPSLPPVGRQSKQAGGSRAGLLSGGGGGASSDGEFTELSVVSDTSSTRRNAAWTENESSLGSNQQQQAVMHEEQEQELGMLSHSLDRLGHMGKTIGDELRTQGKELDHFAEEVDLASDKMHSATAVMKKMLKQKDRGKICCILTLSLVLILLLYAVIAW